MRRLIVNADDYNFTPGVCRGIIRAYRDGIVRSTTVMVNMPGAEEAVELLKTVPGLATGIHLNITKGAPVSPPEKIPTLVGKENNFKPHNKFRMSTVDMAELKTELDAQVEKARALGLTLSHIDSHHHIHTFPDFSDVFFRVAKEQGLPLRSTGGGLAERLMNAGIKTTKNFIGEFYDEGASLDNLLELLSKTPEGESVELMCHPAEIDQELIDSSSYVVQRAKELEILTSPGLEEKLKGSGFELITYRDL
ncbi:MAG: chitin disaccharide deacetylase [Chloroflexi bacterium]|nr:chitin disaccharide deacetylase [Chloroflexota bacterium]